MGSSPVALAPLKVSVRGGRPVLPARRSHSWPGTGAARIAPSKPAARSLVKPLLFGLTFHEAKVPEGL